MANFYRDRVYRDWVSGFGFAIDRVTGSVIDHCRWILPGNPTRSLRSDTWHYVAVQAGSGELTRSVFTMTHSPNFGSLLRLKGVAGGLYPVQLIPVLITAKYSVEGQSIRS